MLGRGQFDRLDLLVVGERHFGKEGFCFFENLTHGGALVGDRQDHAFQLIDKRAHDGGCCRCRCEEEFRVFYLMQVHDGEGINVPCAVGCQERRPQCFVGFGFGSEVDDPRLQVDDQRLSIGVGKDDIVVASEIGSDKIDAYVSVDADQLGVDGGFQEGFVDISSVFIELIVVGGA